MDFIKSFNSNYYLLTRKNGLSFRSRPSQDTDTMIICNPKFIKIQLQFY